MHNRDTKRNTARQSNIPDRKKNWHTDRGNDDVTISMILSASYLIDEKCEGVFTVELQQEWKRNKNRLA